MTVMGFAPLNPSYEVRALARQAFPGLNLSADARRRRCSPHRVKSRNGKPMGGGRGCLRRWQPLGRRSI